MVYADWLAEQPPDDEDDMSGYPFRWCNFRHEGMIRHQIAAGANCIFPCHIPGFDRVDWHRGFIHTVRCTLDQFLEYGAKIACEHPVVNWEITDRKPVDRMGLARWFYCTCRVDDEVYQDSRLNHWLPHFLFDKGDDSQDVFSCMREAEDFLLSALLKWSNAEADKLMGVTSTV